MAELNELAVNIYETSSVVSAQRAFKLLGNKTNLNFHYCSETEKAQLQEFAQSLPKCQTRER